MKTFNQFKSELLDEAFKLGYVPRIGKSSHYHPTEIIKAKPPLKPIVAKDTRKSLKQTPEKDSHRYWISHQGENDYRVGEDGGTIARTQSHEHAMEIMHTHAKKNKFKDYHLDNAAGPILYKG